MIKEALDAQIDGLPEDYIPIGIELGQFNFKMLQAECSALDNLLKGEPGTGQSRPASARPSYRGITIKLFDDPPHCQRLQVFATKSLRYKVPT